MSDTPQAIARRIIAAAAASDRFIVALAGPPGAGKSTLSDYLCKAIEAELPGQVVIVPMDGYHLDNAVLGDEQMPFKGAPHTFDVDGLRADLLRIRRADAAVAVPVFDRSLDLARAAGRMVALEHRIILVEGNYLLLDQAPWPDLAPLFDFSVMLEVEDAELERRLVKRWRDMGHDLETALAKARDNDMRNARLVKRHSRAADLIWR